MAHLSIRLLGPFSVHLNDNPVSAFRSDKVRALLAYLVAESDRAFRRETLAGLLWPEVPEASAHNSLRTALVNLRTVIGDRAADPPYLHISRTTLQFNAESDAWCDLTAFHRSVASSANPPHEQGAIQSWEEAVELYRGSFLEGFSLADSVAFEDWALIVREQLQRQVLEALYHLAAFHEQRAEHAKALPFAWRQVELDPWREEAQRQLMRVLAQSGQKSAALAQYEACRQALADELGVEPEAETTSLYEHIRDGELASPSGPDSRMPGQTVEPEDAPRSAQAQANDQVLRGQSLQEQGQYDRARDCLERAVELYRELGIREREASARVQLGRVCAQQGHHAMAQAELEHALRFYHETRMQWDKAAVLVDLGSLLRDMGEFTPSLMHVYPALGIYREMYRQQGHDDRLTYLDETFRYLDPPAVLCSAQQPTLEADSSLHEPFSRGTRPNAILDGDRSIPLAIARSLLLFVSVLGARGHDTAERCLEDCTVICHRAGFKNELGVALALRGWANRHPPFLCSAIQVGLELGSTEPVLYALPAFVRMLAKQGQTELAIEVHALALRECPTTYNTRWLEHILNLDYPFRAIGSTLQRQAVAQARARGRARDLWATVEELYAVWCE